MLAELSKRKILLLVLCYVITLRPLVDPFDFRFSNLIKYVNYELQSMPTDVLIDQKSSLEFTGFNLNTL